MTMTVETLAVAPPSTRTVVFSLGRFEAWRALRHPLTLLGAASSVWLMWILGGNVAPILERESVFLAGAMLPLAATTLLVANYSVLRQRRVLDVVDAYPSGTNRRILGVQIGLLGPLLLAVLLQAVGLIYLQLGGPIGTVDLLELAVGPLMVMVLGLGGVALGRWLPHPIVAPVALIGLGAVQLLASPDSQLISSEPTANFEWLAPWMTPSAFMPIEDLAGRPSALHFAYLVLLGLVLGGLVLKVRGNGRLIPPAVIGMFVVAVVVVSTNLPADANVGFDWPEAAANQVCSIAEGIEYCAFEFYADWIPRWQQTVAAVDAVFPVPLRRVMQRPPNIGFEEPGALEAPGLVISNTSWDREGAVPVHQFDLALLVAHSAVGLPTTPQTRAYTPEEIESIVKQNPGYPGDLRAQLKSEGPQPMSCSAIGQARIVVALWLAATALERGPLGLQEALDAYPTSDSFRLGYQHFHNPPTSISRTDAELAQTLLGLPPTEVRARLESHWPQVIDPATTSTDLAGWFGLSAPVPPAEEFYEAPCH